MDKNNISDYLTLPKYILKKVNKGKITVTHFSDILRAGLLFNYGGIWIDSTCYIIKDEFDKITHYSFYTQKYKPNISNFFNEGKWSGFFMGAGKNNPFEYFLYNIFLSYWKKYDTLVDYFLIDIFISIGYENINLIKEMIDKVPYNNSDIMIANQINNFIIKKKVLLVLVLQVFFILISFWMFDLHTALGANNLIYPIFESNSFFFW